MSGWLSRIGGVVAVVVLGTACASPGVDVALEPEPMSSGIAALAGDEASVPESLADEVIAWHWARRNAVAACMTSRGFEYVAYLSPVTVANLSAQYDAPVTNASSGVDDPLWAPRLALSETPPSGADLQDMVADASMVGFGVFHDWWRAPSEAEDDALVVPDEPDPNAEIFRELDPAGQVAYLQALAGSGTAEATDEPSPDIESCEQWALTAVGEPPHPPGRIEGIDLDLFMDLSETVDEAVREDARFVDSRVTMEQCLAARGYPTDPMAYVVNLKADQLEVVTGDRHGVLPAGTDEAAMAAAFGEERLAELQAEEIGAATAWFSCFADHARVWRQLIAEYETSALAANPVVADAIGWEAP